MVVTVSALMHCHAAQCLSACHILIFRVVQNRICMLFMTVCAVNFLFEMPYIHRMYVCMYGLGQPCSFVAAGKVQYVICANHSRMVVTVTLLTVESACHVIHVLLLGNCSTYYVQTTPTWLCLSHDSLLESACHVIRLLLLLQVCK
jgi:hypothetical protein